MKETTTAGGRSSFKYAGSMSDGFKLLFPSKPVFVHPDILAGLLDHFKGKTVLGGFHATKSPEDSVGHYISSYKTPTLKSSLSPVYGSHIVGILRELELITVGKDGSAIIVKFHK